MPRAKAPLVVAFLAVAAAPIRAQEHDVGSWWAFAGQGHLRPGHEDARWRWWLDVHARFQDDSDGFNQSIVRPAFGYDVAPSSTVWLGYGWFVDDPRDRASFDEHRIWQQFTHGTPTAAGALFSRTRLEQRLVQTGDDTGWRFRQFLRLVRPFSSESRHAFRVWDEIFFDLNDTDWGADTGFAQNRLFAGLGWTLDDARHFTLEYGYLNQFIERSGSSDSMNHILSVTLLLSL